MRTVYQTAKPFDKLLKPQKVKIGEKYRPMYYVVEQLVDEGLLLYHTMTKAMQLLTPEEAEIYRTHPTDLPQLIELWFLVPTSHDDRLLSRQIRDIAQMLEKKSDAITSYTILTTTDCNARCFYCYEMGRPRVPMCKETAEKTADFIIKHCHGEKVKLSWFGGEPLFNKPVISLICKRLKEAEVNYHSTMVTNGFLYDDNTIKEAKKRWNLGWVQITLDGTEEKYNRSKAFIYKGVNAYKRVINNIHKLQDANIEIQIRLNIDMHNAENLMELAEQLHLEFPDPNGITVYLHPLFENSKGSGAMHQSEKRAYIYNKMEEINNLIGEYGFAKPIKLERKIKTNICQADNDHCVVIMPNGNIGKCEHYTEDHFVGHISNDGFDKVVVDSFKERRKEIDACATCPVYPNCLILKLCDANKHCYRENQIEKIQNIRCMILNAYYKKCKEDEL